MEKKKKNELEGFGRWFAAAKCLSALEGSGIHGQPFKPRQPDSLFFSFLVVALAFFFPSASYLFERFATYNAEMWKSSSLSCLR